MEVAAGGELRAHDAAAFGVWLHGKAGDAMAASVGPLGFLASDVMDAVPGEIRDGMESVP